MKCKYMPTTQEGGNHRQTKWKNVDIEIENSEYRAKKLDDVLAKKAKAAEYSLRPETIIVAGSARLPEEVTAKHVFGCITIELEIDLVDSTIVDVSCILIPSLGGKILHNALLGNNVDEGIEKAIIQLDRRFFNVTRRAVIAALEDAYRWYKKFLGEKRVMAHRELHRVNHQCMTAS